MLIMTFWRVINPVLRPLSGLAPWWVLVETTGRVRRTPLASGPRDADGMLPWDAGVARTFNAYARSGPGLVGRDPLIVRLKYDT